MSKMPKIGSILALVFLVDTAAGASMFAIFRWVADQKPSLASLQLGLIGALGSLSYLLACVLVSRLGDRLAGRNMPACGLVAGVVILALLAVNRSVWAIYLLWPGMTGSFALLFPSFTGWIRYGRSGRSLRVVLFAFCIAWMSGVTFGAYFGAKLYAVFTGQDGASYVYLANIGIYLICLLLLYVPGQKDKAVGASVGQEPREQVDPAVARVFMRMGWMGNILVMLCMSALLQLFNKVATDLEFGSEVHGWLIVMLRTGALVTTGLMFWSLLWHYRWWSFMVAQGLAVVGLCLVGTTSDYWVFLLGFVLTGIMLGHNYYAGVYYSLSSVSAGDPTGQRSKAAINEAFFSIGAMVGAGLGGLAGLYWVRLPYFLVAGTVLVIFAIQINMLRKSRTSSSIAAS